MSGASTPRRSTNGEAIVPVIASSPDKSGHVGNMDEHQRQTLDAFEQRLKDDGLMPTELMDDNDQRDVVLRCAADATWVLRVKLTVSPSQSLSASAGLEHRQRQEDVRGHGKVA